MKGKSEKGSIFFFSLSLYLYLQPLAGPVETLYDGKGGGK